MEDSNPNATGNANYKRAQYFTIFVVAVLFAIGIYQTLSGSTGSVASQIDNRLLGVSGTYGDAAFVELDAITDVQLVDTFDFGTCLEGEETGNTVSGRYSNDAYPEYTVHAYTKISSFIIVTHPDGVLVFNCASQSQTETTYDNLVQATGE